ncbi:MAG: hypothetical protein LUM44_23140 [Pyrinomonadaceae bacterium]|nr:hypothetical protein [Pyrinomonadaceae bacterium]
MKLLAFNRLKCFFVILFCFFSIHGQTTDTCEVPQIGEVVCYGGSKASCELQKITDTATKFLGRCKVVTRFARLYLSGKNLEADAAYYSEMSGEVITASELAKDKKRQQELQVGKITKSDGTIITFTPIEEVKGYIKKNPEQFDPTLPESRFERRRELNGFDEAWEKYLDERNGQISTPAQIDFLTRIGDEYLNAEDASKAVKIFKKLSEITASTNNPALVDAQLKLGDAQVLIGKPKDAVKTFQRVGNNPNVTIEQKKIADQSIQKIQTTIRNQ